MVRGSPFMCMTTRPASQERATSTIAGSRKPDTSLMMAAPASTQARATSAWRVSMLTQMPAWASSRTTSTVRESSSATDTSAEPGRVDSPPTSMTFAPCSIMLFACAIAASCVLCSPPSENESGVTFKMPITMGILTSKLYEAHCQFTYALLSVCYPCRLCHCRHGRHERCRGNQPQGRSRSHGA